AELLGSPATRGRGARAALQLGRPELEPPLLSALPEASAEDKPVVLDALGRLGPALSPAGRSALYRALSDGRAAVRAGAVRALEQ
ncbi:hypothetical protein ACTUM1_15630, partial [Listeria monocytogenes]|uniref:hypothetical protein n=1 Tax=Listeria monocytogenes TaxID=1639 RepID=UPI003FA4751E